MDVTLEAYDAARTSYSLVASASPWKLIAYEWGNAVWDHQYSGPRGTLGARPTYSTVQNRQVGMTVRLLPASKGAMPGHLADLADVVDRMRQHGGRIAVTTASVTYTQYLEVLAGAVAMQPWTNRAEHSGLIDVNLAFVCEPLVRGASMEVNDRFTTDTRTDYTYDTGSSSSFSVSGGDLVPTGTSAAVAIHTATGYAYGDHGALIVFNLATLAAMKIGVVLKRLDADDRLEVYVDDTGAASRLRIDKVVAGVVTNLASTTLTRLTAGARVTVAGRIEGNRVYAAYFLTDGAFTDWSFQGSVNVTLTSAEAAAFGEAVTGQAGFVWDPASTSERVEEFHIQPYCYGLDGWTLGHPAAVTMYGAIPGDAPAIADLVVQDTTRDACIAAWARRPLGHNLATNGDLDDTTTFSSPGRPWSVSAVTGVTGAATSMTVASGGYRSRNSLSVTCPATANTGASLRIGHRFKAGTSYTVRARLRAASATTTARVRLGVNGDIASTTAVALSTTWVEHTTTWTPTADVDLAYFAAEITAATGTTFQVDSVEVYETLRPPSLTSQTNGRGGRPLLAVLDATDAQGGGTYTTGLGSGYRNGAAIRSTTNFSVSWPLDADLFDGDDYGDNVEVEVWARIISPGWSTNGRVDATIYSPGTTGSSTREGGQVIRPSHTNLARVGTIPVPRSRAIGQPGRTVLQVDLTVGSGGGNLDLDYVVVVPARSRCLSPTGVDGSDGYPFFLGSAGARLIRPTLEGYTRDNEATGYGPDSGLGGSLIQLPPGENVALVRMCGIPDRTDTNPADPVTSFHRFRFSPTPRWHYLRDE